jgi:hypothetical protein
LLSDGEFKTITQSDCSYCGARPSLVSRIGKHSAAPACCARSAYVYNGVDRLDNNKGYEAHNCVACCKTCNLAKRDMSRAEFFAWARRVAERAERETR